MAMTEAMRRALEALAAGDLTVPAAMEQKIQQRTLGRLCAAGMARAVYANGRMSWKATSAGLRALWAVDEKGGRS